VTLRLDVRWGDVDGWKAFSMSTGQRAMWAAVPAEERDGLLVRAGEILEAARDDTGRVGIWQDMRYTLGTAPRRNQPATPVTPADPAERVGPVSPV